jgi:uncharacterized membrane protein YqjE
MNEATHTRSDLHQDGSITTLIAGIINDAQRLISQQLDLLKVELREDLRRTINGAILIAAGAGLLLVGFLLLCFMVVYLLSWALPNLSLWLCFLIVGGLLTLLGATLVLAAVRRFSTSSLLPEQSLQGLKENMQWKTNLK